MTELNLRSLRRYLLEQDLMFLAGEPVVYHCHHFNLFLDQTIDDALGSSEGARLRTRAGREFSHYLLRSLVKATGASTALERLQLASEVFSAMGHGRLDWDVDARGGTVRGSTLHYGFSWREKYGDQIRRRHPADAFAAGFAAAALEVAYDQRPGGIAAEEKACIAMRAEQCEFALSQSDAAGDEHPHIGEAESAEVLGTPEDGIGEDVIQPIAAGLKEFTAGVRGDERGLVQAFGVFATMHMAGYYNRISFDAVHELGQRSPQSVPVLEDLLRESGHVCVFNTFGGVLLSPEWEGLVGPVTDEPQVIVTWCMAIARAFGFGRWTVSEFEPGKRLVIRTSGSYESTYYRCRHGVAKRSNEYMLQGAAMATAQLAHRVNWTQKPELTPAYYQSLFKGGVPWRAEQTKSIVMGDPVSEVVVTNVGA